MNWTRSLAVLSLLVSPGPLWAHHGNSAYDLDHPITLKATITEFDFVNPHVQIYFDANSKGKIEHWSSETVSPGMLIRSGWKKDELKPGEHIAITIAPAKSGETVGYVLEIKTDDGRDYKLGQGRDRPYP
jgi:hypothetical protein